MRFFPDYDRKAVVMYAHRWAYGRNPEFYDYESLGGDCTNFASQCIYAGSGIMNFTPTYSWYYIDANQKAPAWTGVEYFYNFLTKSLIFALKKFFCVLSVYLKCIRYLAILKDAF